MHPKHHTDKQNCVTLC